MTQGLVKRLDILTIGETLVDCIAQEKDLPLAQVTCFKEYLGGSPANIACAVARLGGRSGLVSKVGNDSAGQMCLQELEMAGVDTSAVVVEPEARTSRIFISRTEGTPEFHVERAADKDLTPAEVSDFTPTRLMHASTFSLSVEPLRSAVIYALTQAFHADVLISLDPNYHPHIWPDREEALVVLQQLYPMVALTKPSLDDAKRLFGPGLSCEAYLERFLDMGAQLVVLTSGPEFVVVGDRDGYNAYIPVPRVQVADVTGAGDWFWAAFLLAYLDGLPHREAVQFANKIAAHKLGMIGPILTPIDRKSLY